MTYEAFIKLVCVIHLAILASAFTVFIKFSSLSSGFRSWRNDVEETLKNVKRSLAINLGEKLKPILANAGTTTTAILDASGSFGEKAVSPTEGEDYRNALFEFINDKAQEMAQYRSLLLSHKAYSFWAIYLSCTLLILMPVELVMVGLIGYFGVLKGQNISDIRITISFAIAGVGVVICFLGVIFLLINHNKGLNARGCHD